MSRPLTCTRCHETVTVYELPVEHIDPTLFVCGACLRPIAGQLELDDQAREETRQYDPAIAEIGF